MNPVLRPRRTDLAILVMAVLVGSLLAWLSVARYTSYNIGMYDLGNMSQAIWSAAHGHPLVYTASTGNTSRLSGHVELIYFLFAPLYALWPDPRLLLIAQAGLFALGALPVYWMTLRRTDSVFVARCLALIYLLYPTAQTSVLFDFHGDTLAMPLLLFVLDALDRKAWRRYALFVALALSCKFYVAIAVAGIGFYVFVWGKNRRVGLFTLTSALLYGAVAFLVVRPAFAPPSVGAAVTGNYISYYFGQVEQLVQTIVPRAINALIVFGPVLFVAWRGWRWLIPGLPIAAAALISTGPGGAYDFRYHHYAVVVPFIVMATIDGVDRMRQAPAYLKRTQNGVAATRRRTRSWKGDVGFTLGIVIIFSVLLVRTPLNPMFWVGETGYGFDPSVYGRIARDKTKDAFISERVPQGAPIAASNQLAPHLTQRDTLYLLRYPNEPQPKRLPDNLRHVDYAVADALFDYYVPTGTGYGGGIMYDREAIGLLLGTEDFGLVDMRDGLLLFKRSPAASELLSNTLRVLDDDGAVAQQSFGPNVALVRHQVEQIDQNRLRARFTWRRTGDLLSQGEFVAVSRLEGLDHARFVHLPSAALYPLWEWPAGKLIEETFDIVLPSDTTPGSYMWRTGWYNAASPYAYASDPRSLLADSQEIAVGSVTVR